MYAVSRACFFLSNLITSMHVAFEYFFIYSDDAISIEMHGIKKEKIIKAGDTITAECILTGGNPLGKITWYKGMSTSMKKKKNEN
jgi:hypothetical protein